MSAEIYNPAYRVLNVDGNVNIQKCCKMLLNLSHSLGKFSQPQIDDVFHIFPRKQDLTFHANCLHCMKCQILFPDIIRKNVSILLKTLPRVLRINIVIFQGIKYFLPFYYVKTRN